MEGMMNNLQGCFDVIVIGAGPSGAVASALLNKKGYRVLVLEKAHFPRFSIGESLLPQSMAFLEQADMLEAVQAAGFQFKNGAAFSCGDRYEAFDFNEKFTAGWGTTFQVQRDQFDKVLADEAARQGVDIRYGQTVTSFNYEKGVARIEVIDEDEQTRELEARFVLDASGYGRVLPKLLKLEKPTHFQPRTSLFTHVQDHISEPGYDRNKILITVHPEYRDVWFWLIPFSNGRASVGVVAEKTFIDAMAAGETDSEAEKLKQLIGETGWLASLMTEADFDTPVRSLTGYACDVSQMFGPGYALLGNAGEFLDPVFSSGVTIAFKSASLAADIVDQELSGQNPDWQESFVLPLKQGVNTFREFVEGWYDGRLQDVIFTQSKNEPVKRMISSILAGYAWDTKNPYVKDSTRLSSLAAICRSI
jgi:flavin-dependent dehydrogenase